MYPELNPEPVEIFLGNKKLKLPREKIAAAYAAPYAYWEQIVSETPTSFEEQYQKVMPACIFAANRLEGSITSDLLENFHPGKVTAMLMRARLFMQGVIKTLS